MNDEFGRLAVPSRIRWRNLQEYQAMTYHCSIGKVSLKPFSPYGKAALELSPEEVIALIDEDHKLRTSQVHS